MNPTSYQFRNGLRYLRKLAKAPGQAPDLLATTVGTKLQMAKARFLASSGLAAKLYGNYKGRGLVVMFHEIHEDVDAGLRMGCSPAQLENVLQALRSRGRDLVTVEEGLRGFVARVKFGTS